MIWAKALQGAEPKGAKEKEGRCDKRETGVHGKKSNTTALWSRSGGRVDTATGQEDRAEISAPKEYFFPE